MNENKTDSTKTELTDELEFAEADVDRSMAKFSSAIDELNAKVNHTVALIHKPKEKWLKFKTWVAAPENRKAVVAGGLAIAASLILVQRKRVLSR